MKNQTPELERAVNTILIAIQKLIQNGNLPILVAIDGGSGAGKSTLALLVAKELNATLIQSDDFYAANIPHSEWEQQTPEQKVAHVIDWRRMRAEALEPLLSRQPAKYHAFDFEIVHPDGTYPMQTDFTVHQPADIIILDGAYSSRPELADLVDLSVLVDVPAAIRHERLAKRENKDTLEAWHRRWDGAETYYLTQVRPKSSFDLIVSFA